ncbi:hypothetical protein Bhyg_11216 [Pseudolycoriella hygida]|uniref:THAP-type domain-containing protein n=1 Tax=Pseudolycoriella hygida TaxID=35572 RepID=A0A9Q0MV50_9DIPT|nr:hypothetical protein Bhyg_11216 [Pseudolycoriella hygida]
MRSCFVPNCDILCKNMKKRMMFIPPKNKELFNLWKSVLPNRRELKPTDRVCERHFQEDHICKTFDHIINGELHQIDRGKPKLRDTAIPFYNLPSATYVNDFKRKNDSVDPERRSKKLKDVRSRRPIIKRLMKDFNDKQKKENLSENFPNNAGNENLEAGTSDDCFSTATDSQVDEHLIIEPSFEEFHDDLEGSGSHIIETDEKIDLDTDDVECVDANLFDGIYEDIYEVTLPNTLWGVHRDPNRTFIVFSYFDKKTCSTTKLIYLDSDLNANICVKGKIVNAYRSMCNLTIEYLTKIVSQVDEYRICEKFDSNSKCEVVAAECEAICRACNKI